MTHEENGGVTCAGDSSQSRNCTRDNCPEVLKPDYVTDCKEGWFSKTSGPNVNAAAICLAHGYDNIDKFGGNSGTLCSKADNSRGNCCWQCGEICGKSVDWQCIKTGKLKHVP